MFAFRSPATVCGSIASYIFIHSEFETSMKKKTLAFAMRLIMQTD